MKHAAILTAGAATAHIPVDEDVWKKPRYTGYANLYGVALSVLLPFLLFGALTAV